LFEYFSVVTETQSIALFIQILKFRFITRKCAHLKEIEINSVSPAEHFDSSKTFTADQLLSVTSFHQTIHFKSINAFKTLNKSLFNFSKKFANFFSTLKHGFEELNNDLSVFHIISSNKVNNFIKTSSHLKN
jgi:hypothetical protein